MSALLKTFLGNEKTSHRLGGNIFKAYIWSCIQNVKRTFKVQQKINNPYIFFKWAKDLKRHLGKEDT